MTEKEPTIKCDDCHVDYDHRLIDAWLSPSKPENSPQPDAYLCEGCHKKRGPSRWGPWCPL